MSSRFIEWVLVYRSFTVSNPRSTRVTTMKVGTILKRCVYYWTRVRQVVVDKKEWNVPVTDEDEDGCQSDLRKSPFLRKNIHTISGATNKRTRKT